LAAVSDHDPRGVSHRQATEHPLVGALLDEAGAASPRLRLDVDPRDEMFRVAREMAHGNRDQALVGYFRAGLTAARTFGQLLRAWRFPAGERPLRVLDFACGWGRVTRFLTAAFPDLELTVSDISPRAVKFQREVLGLKGFVSATRPEELMIPDEVLPDGGFDAVLAGSLFTHLPEGTFDPWLRRLFELVAPGGVLAVSTHPEERLPEGFSMPSSGLFYESASEIPDLDTADYGRTWVTPERMERAIAAATGEAATDGVTHRRYRRCLWHLQDLWVLPHRGAEDSPDLEALDLDGGPDGRLEGISFEEGSPEKGPDKMWLAGWAAHPLHRDPQVRVEIVVAGETVARVRPDRPRPDVAERLGREELRESGWLAHVPLDGSPAMDDPVLVRAVEGRGLAEVLHLSTFEGLVTCQEAKRLREELTVCHRELKAADGHLKVNAVALRDLKLRLAAMEASRFWKLRNWWFRIRGKEG
jgi:hypothetical protein